MRLLHRRRSYDPRSRCKVECVPRSARGRTPRERHARHDGKKQSTTTHDTMRVRKSNGYGVRSWLLYASVARRALMNANHRVPLAGRLRRRAGSMTVTRAHPTNIRHMVNYSKESRVDVRTSQLTDRGVIKSGIQSGLCPWARTSH